LSKPFHLVDLIDLDRDWVTKLFGDADRLRALRGSPRAPHPLRGKTAALVFHKPSLRTRVSFTVGMHELGGDAVDLGTVEVSEHGRESLKDVAHVLSGMTDLIVIRTFAHRIVRTLAEHATIPVINALTDFSHPCQVLADLYTLVRAGRDLDHLRVAWVGDGSNVCTSLARLGLLLGYDVIAACPEGYEPAVDVQLVRDPREAVRAADVIVTDTWVSMGQEAEHDQRVSDLEDYRLDAALLAHASDDAFVLHCLPAHPGEEITAEVLYGDRSAIWDEAENRLHVQKALLAQLLGAS